MSIWIELHLIIIIIILRQIIELIVPFFEIIVIIGNFWIIELNRILQIPLFLCSNIWFISILLRIAYRIEYRTEIRVKTRTIKTCCKGYAESSDHCIRNYDYLFKLIEIKFIYSHLCQFLYLRWLHCSRHLRVSAGMGWT
jgi:hypothetical protein